MASQTKQTRFGEDLTLEVEPPDSQYSKKRRYYDSFRSLPARGRDLVLKSPVVSWIAPKFTWTNLKPVIRSAVSGWISLLFILIPRTERIMGQASFFILISAFLSPPSMPFAAVLEKEVANNLFVLVAWAWSSLAIRLSMLPRKEFLSDPDILTVFSGRYIEAWPTVICGIFLFFGTAFFAYLKARLGPGQYTVATIFGSLTLLTALTISPLFPYPYYISAEAIVIPLAIHAAITLMCSLIVFPQSVNAQFIKRLSSCLTSLESAIKTQSTLLAVTPFSDEFQLDDFRSHLQAAEAGLPLLAASARLMKRDVSFGRFGGTDLKQLHTFGRQLFVRGEGISFFFKIIDPLREKFPETPHASRFGTPLLTPSVSRPDSPTTPATARGSMQLPHSPLSGDDGRLPDSPVASSAASSLHRRKGRGLQAHLQHLRHLLDEFSHPHEDPVGVFEAQKYMNLETHFNHPQSQFLLERALELLHESCAELLEATADGLHASIAWLENVNASRFRPVRILGGGVKREDASAEVRAAHEKLSAALNTFRCAKRLLILSPYQTYLDIPEHMPPHRFLFQSFVYQFHLTEFATVLGSLLAELLRLDADRPTSRIWWPILPFSAIITSLGESWEVQETTANNEQQEEDPDRIPGIQAQIAYDLGEAHPRNPDAVPPSNIFQLLVSEIADGLEALWKGNALFAIKTAVLTVLLSLPAFMKSSAHFAYVHRAIWAIFIGQVNLARFRGDTIYGFFARLGATFFGGVTGLVIWYTSTGTGNGNPFGLAAVCAVYFPLAFYMLLWSPLHPATNMIFHATVALVIGYSWQDTNLQLPASPGFGWDLPLNLVLLKNIAVTGLHWGAYAKFEPSRIAVVWKELFALVKAGKISPTVYEEIFEGLESVPAGIEAVTKRKTYGKAIVRLRKDAESAKL
ncbi:hypothetical protein AURDEDRAFT_182332 [Auricularia subglabra TFB-10046 SS5]|nr:hypothetical protein AURDEDRAFT_182332 [Auricularia subglabra TFB-10046 SS5]